MSLTGNGRLILGAAVAVMALAVAIGARRSAPALDPHARSYITDGVHDVSRPLREIDQRAAAIDPCAGRENAGRVRRAVTEIIGELFGDACENEAEREAEEALSAGNATTLEPLALAAVPDGGSVEQTSFGPRAALAPTVSFNTGLNSSLDNNIAVGPNNLVAMINSRFQVMTKTGTVTFGPVQNNSIFSGFANGVCANSGDGHVQYDQLAHRWLFTVPNFSSGYWICYAVSTTDDPTGPYYRYAFQRPLFPDYPRVAVWPDGYYTTTSTGDTVIQKTACVVDRAKMLAGQTATQQCFTVNNVSFMEPANLDGQTPPPSGAPALVFAAGGSQLNGVLQDDGIYVYKFHVDWNTPGNSTFTGPSKIAVSPYSFLCGGQLVSCVPQPGSTTRLDAQGDKIMHRAAYRNLNNVESIVLQHSVNTQIGGGGPRWYEFRVNASGDPQLYQQSTYAPDARYRWMGSIGMDRKGGIAIGFSYGGGPYTLPMTTSSCVLPGCDRVGVRFTARQAGDPLGVMTYADGIIASSASAATGGSNRWEDWSVLAIDPSDDCTFWYNGGYMPSGATSYNGRIGAWRLPNCRLDAAGVAAAPVASQPFTGPVATFTDSDLTATSAAFTATIDWGDGTSSPGTVTGGGGSFSVSGSHSYAGAGWRTITTAIAGTEGSTASATSTVLVSSGGPPPTATILTPSSSSSWSVGESLAFSATAANADNTPLDGSAMAWTMIRHYCPSTCDTQIMDARTGVSSGAFTAPDAVYPSTLELRLTVTGTGGLQTTTSVTLQPRTVSLAFTSVPSGLQLTVASVTTATPFSRTAIVGASTALAAPSPQAGNLFASWSDGGVQSHVIAAPSAAATYTATFTAAPPPPPTAISVDFVGSGTSMASSESAGPVARTNWNNATGASRTTPLPLVDETGAATAATITWSSNSTWSTGITDTAGNRRMMKGYLDTTNTSTTSVVVSGVTGAVDIYVMADGSNGSATRTSTYQISGTNITTTSVTLTDAANTNFSSAFTQANNSAGNYLKFSVVATGGFTIRATAGTSTDSNRRAPVNGLQIVPAGPPPQDTTPPAVAISSPAAGTVSGSVSISATASDNVGVVSVQFQRDGIDIGSADTTAPYQATWDTSLLANGTYVLTAIARDAAANAATSAPIAVIVKNDLTPPTVGITAPAAGATVGATVQIAATAADDIGVTSVQFLVNGSNLGAADTTAPYSASWNTSGLTNGSYTLTAIARDAAGRQTTSVPVVVTVFNALPDTTFPAVSLTSPAAGTVSGTVTVAATATDNAAIASVQFRLDGAALGSADTTSPYSISWDTKTASNGAHTLTAVAVDSSGNATTSAGVNVTVSNAAPSGLVAAYGFNENTGTSAADATGNGRTGTIANATWTASGKFGPALTFNGTNALVTIADHSSLDLSTGMTVEAWVYPTSLGSWRSVVMKEATGGLAYALYANENVARSSAFVRLGSADQFAASSTGLPLNAWSHLAATYDGATIRIFLNGVLAGSKAIAGSVAATTGALRIGGNQIWGEYFAGRIDEVRVYNRALSATEILGDMTVAVGSP